MSQNYTNDVGFIKALAELIEKIGLDEIKIERHFGEKDGSLKVRLTKQAVNLVPQFVQAPALPSAAVSVPASLPSVSEAVEIAQNPIDNPGCVTSPMVGTVYLTPEPGAQPFVKLGDQVKQGQTLLIVEAMKTMNQIPAPRAGVVKQILVAGGQPVEYGSALMVIE